MKKTPGDITILHLCTTNDNHMMYGSQDMECERQTFSLPFYLPNNLENKILNKWKKNALRYHFLHVYHKWKSYDVWFLIYGAEQKEFFCILDQFWTFYPLTTQQIKILIKWKNLLEISLFHTCVPKLMIRWCTVPEIWYTTDGWTDKQTDGQM